MLAITAALIVVALQLLFYWKSLKWKSDDKIIEKPTVKLGTVKSLYTVLYALLASYNVASSDVFIALQKKFGKFFIYSHVIRDMEYGILADLEVAKSIMSSSRWSNRLPRGHGLNMFSFNKPQGLFFSNGGYWKVARKVTLKILHQLDFFRQETMQQIVNIEFGEVEATIRTEIDKTPDKVATIRIYENFQLPNLNIVHQLLLGTRYSPGDPTAAKLVHGVNMSNRMATLGTCVFEYFPNSVYTPFVKMHPINDVSNFIYKNLQDEVDQRRKLGSYRTNPVDYVDYFLLELERCPEDEREYLTEQNMMVVLRDILFAGVETTSASLTHVILNFSRRADVQQRIQKEIDQVIGSRQPVYSDKAMMPYTEAFIWESLRFGNPVPLTSRAPNKTAEEIYGVTMPMGAATFINLQAIHHDKDIWPDADVFRPERFLNEAQDTLINLDKIMPFGHGKRHCIGKSVGEMTMFIFLVSFLQKFTFEISDKHPPPSDKAQIGLSKGPLPFYVKIRSRETAQ